MGAPRIACIIGAGYSCAAGVPLASQLMESQTFVPSRSAERKFASVWNDHDLWKRSSPPGATAEQYLHDLYINPGRAGAPPFGWAVELVAAVIASSQVSQGEGFNPRYGGRITRPSVDVHTAFWSVILEMAREFSVITFNYDLLVERALRHRPMKRAFGTGFRYGGLPSPQVALGQALPFSKQLRHTREVEILGAVDLYKLHGSLNWSKDLFDVVIYQDMRAAFRTASTAAIVPPVPEKSIPEWLRPMWAGAGTDLERSEVWVICGYSLPTYDTAARELLRRSVSPNLERIIVLDPQSRELSARYAEVAPGASIVPLPGLPDGAANLRDFAVRAGYLPREVAKGRRGPMRE